MGTLGIKRTGLINKLLITLRVLFVIFNKIFTDQDTNTDQSEKMP